MYAHSVETDYARYNYVSDQGLTHTLASPLGHLEVAWYMCTCTHTHNDVSVIVDTKDAQYRVYANKMHNLFSARKFAF